MSFFPLNQGFNRTLYGTSTLLHTTDDILLPDRNDIMSAYGKRGIHGVEKKSKSNIVYTIVIIVISAIIFIAMVAIYDVIRNWFNNYYSAEALKDPKVNASQEEIDKVTTGDWYGLLSSMVFAGFCIVSAIILIPLLFKYSKK